MLMHDCIGNYINGIAEWTRLCARKLYKDGSSLARSRRSILVGKRRSSSISVSSSIQNVLPDDLSIAREDPKLPVHPRRLLTHHTYYVKAAENMM